MSSSVPDASSRYDVLILGGGPAGLSAALALGRARKRVLLCDGGPRRNAAAEQMHNFVTRDGVSPAEFRAIGREQLREYPSVEVRDVRIEALRGERGAFRATLADEAHTEIESRRVLLATGMIDELLPLEGYREKWGHSILQCPYCHGWEVRERRFGQLAQSAEYLHFALLLRGWTDDVTVFTNGAFDVPEEIAAGLRRAGVRVHTEPLKRLLGPGAELTHVELANGERIPCEFLFSHPKQRQVAPVDTLGLAVDEHGYLQVDPMTRQTSAPGIYAAGDSTTRMQGAIFAAAAGTQAAAMIVHELNAEFAVG